MMPPLSRFCFACTVWWPMGYAQCPACEANTTPNERPPNRTEQHANFAEWCRKNGRQEEKADA